MKSLNDLIWDKDIDLEKGKADAVIKPTMQQICLTNSCGTKPPKPVPVAPNAQCTK